MKYYKTVDNNGNITRIDKSSVNASGVEISELEYNMLKAVIEIEVNGETAETVAERAGWSV